MLGPLALDPRVGHVHFMFLVLISSVFEWNMGFNLHHVILPCFVNERFELNAPMVCQL